MDKYIVATIHPFVFGQEIMLYSDGECIQAFETTLQEMGKMVYNLCEMYGVNKVDFIGGQMYSKRFKDEFAANKFGNRKIELTIR